MSTPGAPPSDDVHASPSSQLQFPSSSSPGSMRSASQANRRIGRTTHTPVPMPMPSSQGAGSEPDGAATPRPRMPGSQASASSMAPPRSNEPLFLPSSTPRRAPAHRGELAGNASTASSPLSHRLARGPRSAVGASAGAGVGVGATRPHPLASDPGLGSDPDLVFPPSTAGTPSGGAAQPIPHSAAPRRHQREVTMHSDAPSLSFGGATSELGDEVPDGQRKVIWGTSVNIDETLRLFRAFLRGFSLKYRWAYERRHFSGEYRSGLEDRSSEKGEMLLYQHYLRTMRRTDQVNLNLRIADLAAYGPSKRLASLLHKYPQEVIPIMDQALKDEMLDLAELDAQTPAGLASQDDDPSADLEKIEASLYKVRPFGLQSINMRALNPNDIDKLVTIQGLVIRATPIVPQMKQAFFRCAVCNHAVVVDVDRSRIAEPDRCPRPECAQVGTMTLVHNRSEFADRQVVRMQETPDVVPDGQTPHTVSLCVYDELVDVSKAGDRVEMTGIFRSEPTRVNPRVRTQKSLFKTYLDVVHIKAADKKRVAVDASTRLASGEEHQVKTHAQAVGVGGEDDEDELVAGDDNMDMDDANNPVSKQRAEQLAKLRTIAERPDVYELLAHSLAPSVWEMDDVKKGILLQLFGGTNKTIATGGMGGASSGPRYRGDINVLMVGDPGTSKSQLLKYVHRIAPRGVYASGRGSSAVGLTAYVTRDPDTKQLVLESGALVLSDGGVCCIDEFDKMADSTRSVLHEVMEQQTVSIAKAGIITTLNARTSVLAAANPIGSKYNPMLPITKNIALPPTLISRFDLVYLVLDKIDEQSDRRLARHLVSLYLDEENHLASQARANETVPLELLTAYIGYARNHISPILSAEAAERLTEEYVSLRRAGDDPRSAEKRITATTRQLESMIRLSEAHARLRLDTTVTKDDVIEAARLIREANKSSATDPVTGLIDLDLINTGSGLFARKQKDQMRNELLAKLDELSGAGTGGSAPIKSVRYRELADALREQSTVGLDNAEIHAVVEELVGQGVLVKQGDRERLALRRVNA